MEDPSHWPRPAKRVFRKTCFRQLKSETRLVREREPSIHHSHSRESQPLFPNFVRGCRPHLAADLLDDKVRHGRIDMNRREPADRPFARVGRHGTDETFAAAATFHKAVMPPT